MDEINTLTFEQAYEALETVITRLEAGELTLEDSVAAYERGRLLAARCQELLDQADLRISTLENDGSLSALDG